MNHRELHMLGVCLLYLGYGSTFGVLLLEAISRGSVSIGASVVIGIIAILLVLAGSLLRMEAKAAKRRQKRRKKRRKSLEEQYLQDHSDPTAME